MLAVAPVLPLAALLLMRQSAPARELSCGRPHPALCPRWTPKKRSLLRRPMACRAGKACRASLCLTGAGPFSGLAWDVSPTQGYFTSGARRISGPQEASSWQVAVGAC